MKLRLDRVAAIARAGLVALAGTLASVAVHAQQTLTQHQRIEWDESQGGIFELPGGASFGASLCAAKDSPGLAQAATVNAHARARLELIAGQWVTISQSPSSEGPQRFACGRNENGSTLVTGVKLPGPAYRIVSVPPGEVLVDGLTGDSVHAVSRYGNLIAVGQPTRGAGGAVSYYRRDGAGVWQFERRHFGLLDTQFGQSVVVISEHLVLIGAPAWGSNGQVLLAYTDPTSGSLSTLFDGPSTGSGYGFGSSLAVDGAWLAVGVPYFDRLLAGGGVAERAGAVYLYEWDSFGWVFRTRVLGNTTSGLLGAHIALATFPGGGAMLVAGAPGELGAHGNARVYTLDGDTWSFRYRLVDDSGSSQDRVGLGVAIANPSRVLVGSPNWGTQAKGAVLAFLVPLFSDGFESGTTGAWAATVP